MRKLLFSIVAGLVVLSLLVSACAKATPVPEEPTAVPPTPEPKFKVGLVTDVGKVDDGTFNQYAYEGMMQAVDELGLESAFIETLQPTDYEKNVEQFVNEGFDMIVTVGFMMGETTQKMAAKYADVNFAIVDFAYAPEDMPNNNIMGLVFREDQAGFLVGALAGLVSESKTVGIVAGMEIPPVKKYRNGYENGVKYVCPDCSNIGIYIDSFVDPARGKAAAESQIAEGADVIFGAGGPTGSGAILGAAQQGVWVLGVDQDEYFTTFKGGAEAGADKLLSSAMKRVDVAVYTAVKNAAEGTFEGGTAGFEAANEGVGLADFHDTAGAIPGDVKAKLDEILGMLADGSLDTGVDPVGGDQLAPEAALGTEENPIIWSVVPSGETERVVAGFEAVADLIFQETGLIIESSVATEYAGVIEAMCTTPPKAHMGSLATFAYVLAADKGCAEAELVAVRYGSPTYNGQLIVRADSGIKEIADLADKTFCRPDPLSTSGWIIPMLTLRAAGIDTDTDLAEVVDAGSHDGVAAAVYNGDCDVGATYVDARTRIEEDYPDVMEQVIVIALTEDIPNDGVQYTSSFPRELRDQINAALLKIAETDEGKEALDTAYQWAALMQIDDTFYDPFRQVLSASGMNLEDLQ